MEQIRPLTSLSQDELIARIEQYIVVVELRDAEIRELYAVNSALLAERDALREALLALINDDDNPKDTQTSERIWRAARAALAQGQGES